MPIRPGETAKILEAANGSPQYLGSVVAITSQNNHDTVSAFQDTGDALKGRMLVMQSDVDFYFRGVTANTGTVTTTNGIYVRAMSVWPVWLRSDEGWIACISATGDQATIRLFEMT